jgi:dnd system-associated protein 4
MQAKKIKDPQIFISQDLRKIFDDMKHYDEFKYFENKDMFMLAVLFGYINNRVKPLNSADKTESGYTRERYLTPQDNAILKAIAIAHTNNIELVDNVPEVYEIAEQYANGGANYLKEFVFDDSGSIIKKFATLIKSECNKNTNNSIASNEK